MPMDSIEELRARISELEGKLAEAEQRTKEFAGQCAEQQHRIRNALQALSLLLSAQARTTAQPEFCLRCISRLASICELNEALCGNEEQLSVAQLLPALADSIQKAFADRVEFDTHVDDDVRLDHRRARCLGLVYSEAAMNALKHGFPGKASGSMRATFRKQGSLFELIVEDDGVGFVPPAAISGHGLGYMSELADQLAGALQFERLQPGSRVRLTFPG